MLQWAAWYSTESLPFIAQKRDGGTLDKAPTCKVSHARVLIMQYGVAMFLQACVLMSDGILWWLVWNIGCADF